MKLAFLIHAWFPWGGQQRDFLRIAEVCHQRGHDLRVYTLKWDGERPDWLDIRLVPVRAMSRHRLYQRYSAWVEQALQREPADCVLGFSCMPGLDLYFAADPCFADKAFHQRPWLYRLTPRCRHFLAFERAVFGPGSDTRALLLSPQQRQRFLAWYPGSEQRLEMLPPGLDRQRRPPPAGERWRIRKQLRQALGLGEDHHLLLQVGSGFRIKGVDRALRAVAALPDDVRELTRYVLVGRDRPGRFLRLARRLGISDNCLFPGGRDDVQRFMLGADLMLHPAYRESAGYTLLEAIINGLPVLTTDTCGYAFHVEQARAGEVCPSPFDQQALNRLLQRMLSAPGSERRQWRDNGLSYGEDESLYRMPEAAADCIERCAAGRGTGAG